MKYHAIEGWTNRPKRFSRECNHNELKIEDGKIVCKCGKEWTSVPEVNETEEHFNNVKWANG